MGQYVNSPSQASLVWLMAVAVLAINMYLVVLRIGGGHAAWVYILVALLSIAYLGFSASLVRKDMARFFRWVRNGFKTPEEDEVVVGGDAAEPLLGPARPTLN
jgi:hypothetical protein